MTNMFAYDFEVEVIEDRPVVDMDGYEFLQSLIRNGKNTLAHHFSRCMFFVCEISKEITQLKYAVLEAGVLISAKYLRKFHRKKAKEEAEAKRLQMKIQQLEAKSRNERAKIKEQFLEFKAQLLAKLEGSAVGIAEEFRKSKSFQRAKASNFESLKETQVSANSQNSTEREISQSTKTKEKASKLSMSFGQWFENSNIDASKFFDQEKFKTYLRTQQGQQLLNAQ